MSYKIVFYDETNVISHEISFFQTFRTLYGLLKNLVTSKINTTNANTDKIAFLPYLLMGYYDKNWFIEKVKLSKKESGFWQIKVFKKEEIIYKNSKGYSLRRIKRCFPRNFKEGITKEQKALLPDAVRFRHCKAYLQFD